MNRDNPWFTDPTPTVPIAPIEPSEPSEPSESIAPIESQATATPIYDETVRALSPDDSSHTSTHADDDDAADRQTDTLRPDRQ